MSTWTTGRGVCVLVAAGMLLSAFLGVAAGAESPGREGEVRIARITVSLQDQPLSAALTAVAELSGRTIEVTGEIDERRVSISLRDATLEESLERILRPLNYTVIWLPGNSLAIHLLGDSENDAIAASDSESREPMTDRLSDNPVSLFPGGEEVLPPSHPGEPGITSADINYYSSFHTQLDPNDEEVLPPSTPETKGMTQDEMDFLTEMHQAENPADAELLPPEGDDEFGLTQAEFEAMQSSTPALPPSQIEVLPPDEPGGIGLTLEELQSITQSRLADDSDVDVVPPD